MTRILLISRDEEKIEKYEKAFAAHEFAAYSDEAILQDYLKLAPDIIFTDGETPATDALILPATDNIELALKSAAQALRLKTSCDTLNAANKELKNDIYNLKVLYDTNSRFAGTLDKDTIIRYMIEGLDRALSFSLCTFTDDETLMINSVCELSDELIEKLNPHKLKVVKTVKNPAKRFSFDVLQYNTLSTEQVKIYREKAFTPDDETFFRTIIAQAVAPLDNARIYKETSRLEQLKSEFVSIVSHELRTPLTSIKNSLDILASGAAPEKFLDMAQRNVKRLNGIIGFGLDLSRIEAGKMNYRFEKSDIHDAIDYVQAEFSMPAKEKGIELNVVEAVGLPPVNADMGRIEQVLSNLVSNALKFTKTKITIKTELVDDGVMVSVEDDGPGVAAEDLEKIFEPFAQVQGTLSRSTGGSGLGLSIAKRFIEAHRGKIWCEPGEGAKFRFTIPLA